MNVLRRLHKPFGWALAIAWTLAAIYLLTGMAELSEVGETVVFARWSRLGAPLAGATWLWAFPTRWTSGTALTVLIVAFGGWAALHWAGEARWLHLAARDAFFLRQPFRSALWYGMTWLYVFYPLAIMAAGCTAVVEFIRHPPAVVRHKVGPTPV